MNRPKQDLPSQAGLKGQPAAGRLPIGKAEDVEFSPELADAEDLIALKRAESADARAEQK
ncbi:YfhD family protein [Paenibacillus marinisediminis]